MRGETIRKHLILSGDVQGVGLRWRLRHAAEAVGAAGWVRNEPDGRVSLELQGLEEEIDRILQSLEQSRYIRIESVEVRRVPIQEGERGFRVLDDRW